MDVDYTSSFGIKSSAGPVVFIVLYVLLFTHFFANTISRPVYAYLIITFFCAARIAAFTLRLFLARDHSGADDLSVFIAYDVLFNALFFGLLWSANALVTIRINLAKASPKGPVSSLLYLPIIFYLTSLVGVALSIAGTVKSGLGTTQNIVNTGNTLRKVASYVFLGCSILVLLRTWFLPPVKLAEIGPLGYSKFGYRYGLHVLLIISILLLIREVFFTVTANIHTSDQNNEAFWYPFAVVTEVLAILLSAAPGLVPDAR